MYLKRKYVGKIGKLKNLRIFFTHYYKVYIYIVIEKKNKKIKKKLSSFPWKA